MHRSNLLKTFSDNFNEIINENKHRTPRITLRDVNASIGAKPFVVYGAGEFCSIALRECESAGISVSCICDTFKTGKFDYGGKEYDIISPKILGEKLKSAIIGISSYQYEREIVEILKNIGFSGNQMVYIRPDLTMSLDEFSSKHKDGYEWAYNFFEDSLSKQLVINKVRLILNDQAIEPTTDRDIYFDDSILPLNTNEVFVDGGAYDGMNTKGFLEKAQSVKHVYAFEPDEINYKNTIKNLAEMTNVTVVPKGLWNTEEQLEFVRNEESLQGSSFIFTSSTSTYHRVSVTSLDKYFCQTEDNLLPTFIKMDIEGSEREALRGSTEILRKCKPKLAICAYHKPEDFYELPRTIYEIRDDYKLTLRQHAYGYIDTVLYAV